MTIDNNEGFVKTSVYFEMCPKCNSNKCKAKVEICVVAPVSFVEFECLECGNIWMPF